MLPNLVTWAIILLIEGKLNPSNNYINDDRSVILFPSSSTYETKNNRKLPRWIVEEEIKSIEFQASIITQPLFSHDFQIYRVITKEGYIHLLDFPLPRQMLAHWNLFWHTTMNMIGKCRTKVPCKRSKLFSKV